jgi:hypothetical protein
VILPLALLQFLELAYIKLDFSQVVHLAEGCSKLLDQRKQAKLQWLQDPSKINGDNLNNKRRETSRHLRIKIGNV